ncbi:GGDEF domain-containing protein [Methylobacterium oryzisoli]|uniref:GGDEF domain-containing protein n=1 Tax=Methylobacterium oryzisoli TaxID=3385502 RepID=UPI0038913834
MQSLIDRGLSRPRYRLRLPGDLEARYHAETAPESGRFVQSWLAVFILFNILSLKADFDAFGAERVIVPVALTLGVFVPVALAAILSLRGRPSPLRMTLAALVTALVDMAVVLNSARLAPAGHVDTYLILATLIPLVVGLIAPLPFRHSLWFCGLSFALYVAGVAGLGLARPTSNGVPLLVASLTLVPIKLSYSREWEAKLRFLIGLRARAQAEELALANRRLTALSQTDALTGVANRRLFVERLAAAWAEACLHRTSVAVILIDIDHFKRLNDTAGHAEGDRCLTRAAALLREVAEAAGGLAARYGGEEFALLLPRASHGEGFAVAEAARRAIAAAEIPHAGLPDGGPMTVSAGVAAACGAAVVREGGTGQLLKAADVALYAAKRNGRNRVESASLGDLAVLPAA